MEKRGGEGKKKNLSRVSSKLDGEGNSKNGIHRANGNKRHLRPLGEAETLEKGGREGRKEGRRKESDVVRGVGSVVLDGRTTIPAYRKCRGRY